MAAINTLVFSDQNFAIFVCNIKTGNFTAQMFSDEFHFCAFAMQSEIIEDKEIGKYLFIAHADGFEQDRNWHLAATIDAEEQDIFRIKLKVEP